MDIKLEAPGYGSQTKLKNSIETKLLKCYGQYQFLNAIDVKVIKQNDLVDVSLQCKPEKGQMLFVNAEASNESTALKNAIKKLNIRIEKYKQKHYHSVHTVVKKHS